MPKYTLLELVQKISDDMDTESVNSIGDTTESSQIASIIEDTYYNLITNRQVPEHKQFIQLTAFADNNYPTHFSYPTGTAHVDTVWYDTSEDNSFEYAEVRFLEPLDFVSIVDKVQSDYVTVSDKASDVKLRIRNDKKPEYYTSFDDDTIVMDSFNSVVDSTLQASKTRAYAIVSPTFSITDSFVPDIDENYFPLLLSESKSVAMSLLAGGSDPKIEQSARRNRVSILNNKFKTRRERALSHYGR